LSWLFAVLVFAAAVERSFIVLCSISSKGKAATTIGAAWCYHSRPTTTRKVLGVYKVLRKFGPFFMVVIRYGLPINSGGESPSTISIGVDELNPAEFLDLPIAITFLCPRR
jgi:hypothetical protein